MPRGLGPVHEARAGNELQARGGPPKFILVESPNEIDVLRTLRLRQSTEGPILFEGNCRRGQVSRSAVLPWFEKVPD